MGVIFSRSSGDRRQATEKNDPLSPPRVSIVPHPLRPCPGGTRGLLDGGEPPGSSNPVPIRDQKISFSTPVFRPDLWNPLLSSLLRLEGKQQNFSNPFRIHKFLFISYSFGIETINTFIRSRSSLENHTRFQTKTAKVDIGVRAEGARGAAAPNPPLPNFGQLRVFGQREKIWAKLVF